MCGVLSPVRVGVACSVGKRASTPSPSLSDILDWLGLRSQLPYSCPSGRPSGGSVGGIVTLAGPTREGQPRPMMISPPTSHRPAKTGLREGKGSDGRRGLECSFPSCAAVRPLGALARVWSIVCVQVSATKAAPVVQLRPAHAPSPAHGRMDYTVVCCRVLMLECTDYSKI